MFHCRTNTVLKLLKMYIKFIYNLYVLEGEGHKILIGFMICCYSTAIFIIFIVKGMITPLQIYESYDLFVINKVINYVLQKERHR